MRPGTKDRTFYKINNGFYTKILPGRVVSPRSFASFKQALKVNDQNKK